MESKLTLTQQTLVAEAVDATVKKHCPYPPLQACAWYALLGSYAANHLLGYTYYRLIGGSLRLYIAPDPGDGKGSLSFDMIADNLPELRQNSDYQLSLSPDEPVQLEFHAWFGVTERYNFTQLRHLEAVDLTSQHYKTWVDHAQQPWLRPPVPKTIWTDEQGLESLAVKLLPCPGLDRIIFHILWHTPEFRQSITYLGQYLGKPF